MSDPMITTFAQLGALSVGRDHEGSMTMTHEALARSRMQDMERFAREHDLARSATAGSRWESLARFAWRRAERARRGAVRPAARLA